MFREHVTAGAALSMLVVVAVYFYALVTDPILLLFLFVITTLGSFLPDVDSDSGIPFYLVYGTMTLAATGVVILYTLQISSTHDWRYMVGIPAIAFVFFWFILGGVLKRWTKHRGIFHSLPALLIASCGTFLLARYLGIAEITSAIFAMGMAVGFGSHLVLDELHAGITLDGIPFNPKQSLGTALKFFSNSGMVNLATYTILAVLLYSVSQHWPSAFAFIANQ